MMPIADTNAMQLHLVEISRTVATGAHAVVLMDQAAWHTTTALNIPKNLERRQLKVMRGFNGRPPIIHACKIKGL